MPFESASTGQDSATERKLLMNEIKHAILSKNLFKLRDKEFIADLKQEAKDKPQFAREKLKKCIGSQDDFLKLKNAYITSEETGSIFEKNIWDISADEFLERSDQFAEMVANLRRLQSAFSSKKIDGETFGELRGQLILGDDLKAYELSFASAMDEYQKAVAAEEKKETDDAEDALTRGLASL